MADYEEKLRPLLDEAFGPGLPVLYSELGVETRDPARRRRRSTRARSRATPVDEPTQADFYRRAIELAACQENVAGLLLFHSHDEPALTGFQSGVYYVDGTAKASLEPVRDARGTYDMPVSSDIQGGQYVAYTFFKTDPAWRRLPVEERAAMKDAFADVVESWSDRFEHLRAYSTAGVRPDVDFFLWKITERYADLGELGAALNGDAARRLARDAVLLPRDDEGLAVHPGAPAAEDHPEGLAVPRRLPVREGAAVVRALARGPAARDGRAHPRRPRVRDDPQPHDLLVRDRRPGVHDRVRVRRAVRLHAPDADAARERGLAPTPSATRRSSSARG